MWLRREKNIVCARADLRSVASRAVCPEKASFSLSLFLSCSLALLLSLMQAARAAAGTREAGRKRGI